MLYPHILLPRLKVALMNFVFFVDITKSPLGFRIGAPAYMAPIVYHFSSMQGTSSAAKSTRLTYVRRSLTNWIAQLDGVKANFAGKKVATFGLGDSVGFADSFCVAAETLATAAKDAGATLVGEVLKLDDTNEADQTDSKIAAWVETLKAAL